MVPITVLSTGVRVANFSSPHPFTFDDGSVLEACAPERSRETMLESREVETPSDKWTDIRLSFQMTESLQMEIDRLNNDQNIDIVLVPFPVMSALKESGQEIGKVRVCRVADRVTKTICHNKFCI